jgi:hypothetical protein
MAIFHAREETEIREAIVRATEVRPLTPTSMDLPRATNASASLSLARRSPRVQDANLWTRKIFCSESYEKRILLRQDYLSIEVLISSRHAG